MSRADLIELEGMVVADRGNGHFDVECDGGLLVQARLGGRIKKNKIRVVLHDQVKVSVSPYDGKIGFITWRAR